MTSKLSIAHAANEAEMRTVIAGMLFLFSLRPIQNYYPEQLMIITDKVKDIIVK